MNFLNKEDDKLRWTLSESGVPWLELSLIDMGTLEVDTICGMSAADFVNEQVKLATEDPSSEPVGIEGVPSLSITRESNHGTHISMSFHDSIEQLTVTGSAEHFLRFTIWVYISSDGVVYAALQGSMYLDYVDEIVGFNSESLINAFPPYVPCAKGEE